MGFWAYVCVCVYETGSGEIYLSKNDDMVGGQAPPPTKVCTYTWPAYTAFVYTHARAPYLDIFSRRRSFQSTDVTIV